jgi:hypothetical protein
MGIAPEVVDTLTNHLAKIHKASIQSEAAIQQVMEARSAYLKKLQAIVPSEKLSEYQRDEELRTARHEVESIQGFLSNMNGDRLDSASEEILKNLIFQNTAYSEKLAPHGPFDDLPEIRMGDEAVLQGLEDDVASLARKSAKVLDEASRAGFGNEQIKMLERYFAGRAEEKRGLIERIRHPPMENDFHAGHAH